jgi:hypothetical protein
LLSENEQKLKEVEDKMKQEGLEKCCSVVCDVRDPDQACIVQAQLQLLKVVSERLRQGCGFVPGPVAS